jgi:hypothetical protein
MMIANDELERMWKEAVVAYYLNGRTEMNNEKPTRIASLNVEI